MKKEKFCIHNKVRVFHLLFVYITKGHYWTLMMFSIKVNKVKFESHRIDVIWSVKVAFVILIWSCVQFTYFLCNFTLKFFFRLVWNSIKNGSITFIRSLDLQYECINSRPKYWVKRTLNSIDALCATFYSNIVSFQQKKC